MSYDDASWRDRFRLDGKVAVVTGASSGLGVAIAQGLAASGASVVIGARRTDMLETTRSLVEDAGGRCIAVETDVTKVDDCDRLVAAAVDELGGCDVLINNAGIGGDYNPATEDPPDHFRHVVDVNLMGSYWMAQAAGRVMPPGSSIVNFSSVMALTTARMPATGYSAAKAGVLGMTRDLAAQWGGRGIRVNAILPGVFLTEATANYSPNYQRKLIDARVPIGRLGDPIEIASTVTFLASDASAYVTGVGIPVDGGVLLL
ncbi:NAD(P)-dependent dehydrogenase (short-subunit alcohol dehydrogenase family) [Nocardioides sp. BE266]|uniref:SDR family NAD(P)-dependent oxidoreductase n=1 Tax=Nocardioides sp. BE266 TaxID=2817725 RepID=UPI0028615CF7|nr:SDR family oxidoreductase [Nocardioides sp. BE266]MDR7254233.1 NAD(P)-dependent dehydrogenase (short-subunit alcohol dehydrogenase family) [Nocardioides sp. BE266]